MRLGAAWIRGASSDDEREDAAMQRRALAIPVDAEPLPGPEPLELPRSAWPAIRLASAAWSQWRWIPGMRAVPTGLDRAAIVALAPIIGVQLTEPALRDLGWIEAGAIEAMTGERR